MAMAIPFRGFNDLGRSVTPIFLSVGLNKYLVQMYDISYIHLHYSPSMGILRTHNVTSSQMA